MKEMIMNFSLNDQSGNPLNNAIRFDRNDYTNQTLDPKDVQIRQLRESVRVLEQKIKHLQWAARINELS